MLLVNGSKYGSTDGKTFFLENISKKTEENQTHYTNSDSNYSVASPLDTSTSLPPVESPSATISSSDKWDYGILVVFVIKYHLFIHISYPSY